MAPRKRTTSPKLAGGKLPGRSRITNGSHLLPGTDGRSVWARRFRDLLLLHQQDLGGEQAVSEAERSLIRRAAALTVELEHLELRFAENGGASPDELLLYGTTSNTLRRLLQTVGLQRRARDITPDPLRYAEQQSVEIGG